MNIEDIKQKLSADLLPICEFELENGNEIERVDDPAGSGCPFAVVFRRPLSIPGTEAEKQLSDTVGSWECRDPHYPRERGYVSMRTHHAISGPMR